MVLGIAVQIPVDGGREQKARLTKLRGSPYLSSVLRRLAAVDLVDIASATRKILVSYRCVLIVSIPIKRAGYVSARSWA